MSASGRFGVAGLLAMLVGIGAGCGVGSPVTPDGLPAAKEAPFTTTQVYGAYYRQLDDDFYDDDYEPFYGYDDDDYYVRRGRYGQYGRYGFGYSTPCYGGYVNPTYYPRRVVEENAVAFRLRGQSIWRPKCVSAPNIAEENNQAYRLIGQSIWRPK